MNYMEYQFVVEDDGIYKTKPINDGKNIWLRELVMPKDIFVECVNRWIKEKEGE